ncbi:MAG: hypothetical protein QM594_10090 [Niabella sp.]
MSDADKFEQDTNPARRMIWRDDLIRFRNNKAPLPTLPEAWMIADLGGK